MTFADLPMGAIERSFRNKFGEESRKPMRRFFLSLICLTVVPFGCGPGANALREKTLSVLNTEADQWDGGKTFPTVATDAYGRPLTSTVKKTTLDYVLELRSNGPDGLPKNSDDIVVTRSKRHNETSITEEAAKTVEGVSKAATSGIIKGVKKGLRSGGREEKKE